LLAPAAGLGEVAVIGTGGADTTLTGSHSGGGGGSGSTRAAALHAVACLLVAFVALTGVLCLRAAAVCRALCPAPRAPRTTHSSAWQPWRAAARSASESCSPQWCVRACVPQVYVCVWGGGALHDASRACCQFRVAKWRHSVAQHRIKRLRAHTLASVDAGTPYANPPVLGAMAPLARHMSHARAVGVTRRRVVRHAHLPQSSHHPS
jgi:hypothetical protein